MNHQYNSSRYLHSSTSLSSRDTQHNALDLFFSFFSPFFFSFCSFFLFLPPFYFLPAIVNAIDGHPTVRTVGPVTLSSLASNDYMPVSLRHRCDISCFSRWPIPTSLGVRSSLKVKGQRSKVLESFISYFYILTL